MGGVSSARFGCSVALIERRTRRAGVDPAWEVFGGDKTWYSEMKKISGCGRKDAIAVFECVVW